MGRILAAAFALALAVPASAGAEPVTLAARHYVVLLAGMQVLHACAENVPGHAEGRIETAVEVAAEAQTEIGHAESVRIAHEFHERFMSRDDRAATCERVMKDGPEAFVDRLLSE